MYTGPLLRVVFLVANKSPIASILDISPCVITVAISQVAIFLPEHNLQIFQLPFRCSRSGTFRAYGVCSLSVKVLSPRHWFIARIRSGPSQRLRYWLVVTYMVLSR